ncbi:MAG: hypothetical protein FWB86_01925 [Treponema sp.]|nr:hypothetical protein [Treponema sp.]MCL2250918.1 hypothetical protein [Treponema sp.]
MKKFFITLFILIILGGAAFFFGWVQFQIPPGQYGVISSKTHGIDQKLVRSGEFRWVWYRLLPTNVKISIFHLEHTKFPFNFNNTLPSGNTYATFAGLSNVDFTWNLKGEISFSLNPEYLVNITSAYSLLSQSDLEAHLEKTAKDIEVIILRTLTEISVSDTGRLERIMSGNTDPQLEMEIKRKFPEISDFRFMIQSAKFPDFILYTQLRRLYEEFLDEQRDYVTSSFGRRAESHIEAQIRFEELEKYGSLLTKYPVLLEYMQLGLDNQ